MTTLENDQRRPGRGSGATIDKQTNHRITRPTDIRTLVRGRVLIDLSDLDGWAPISEARMRLAALENLPAGCEALLRIGRVAPIYSMLADLDITASRILVEGDDPVRVGEWVRLVRRVAHGGIS